MLYFLVPFIISTLFVLFRVNTFRYQRDVFFVGSEEDGRKYVYFGWYGEWFVSVVLNILFLLFFVDASLLIQHYIFLSIIGFFLIQTFYNSTNPKNYNPKEKQLNLKESIVSKIVSLKQYKKQKRKK